ncbi:cupin domain-containing protein [Frondihabitans australicus]|uniref:(S)-ureidoglycine aminohydrolase cupin domain-containing protein n=1 Tax=Frondihabitans australicus TaxID=386892 RepID=A0A495IC15_9MICO|nr:cupin domain-containing protein [Frondihabitans australicus]RKR73537.1 hypothetical protein C8E83_0630 [Frondihabitans australicus]
MSGFRSRMLAEIAPSLEDVDEANVISGSPQSGTHEIATLGDVEVGVWEHTVGASSDVEVDEVSLIVAGSATVDFLDDAGAVVETVELAPGLLLALHAGERTRWTVREPLRKLYVAR